MTTRPASKQPTGQTRQFSKLNPSINNPLSRKFRLQPFHNSEPSILARVIRPLLLGALIGLVLGMLLGCATEPQVIYRPAKPVPKPKVNRELVLPAENSDLIVVPK